MGMQSPQAQPQGAAFGMGKPFGGVGPGPMPAGAYSDPLSMMRGREGLPQQQGNYGQALQALMQMMQQPGAMGLMPPAVKWPTPQGGAPGAMPGAPLTPPVMPAPYAGPAPQEANMPPWGSAPSVGRVLPGGMRNVRGRPTGWRRKA